MYVHPHRTKFGFVTEKLYKESVLEIYALSTIYVLGRFLIAYREA